MVFSFLDAIEPGTDVRITRVDLEDSTRDWLKAVGLEEGAFVRILRRAPFGGPLHVRSSAGTELAIHRSLARALQVAAPPSGASSAESGAALSELGPASTA